MSKKLNENMFLYWGSGSPPCWRAMIVLEKKGLYKNIPQKLCEFSKKEHKGEDVLKLNPRGQVPTFKDGDVVVNESAAICMYLEEKHSNDSNKLFPVAPAERAQVYQRMFEADNLRAKITEPLVYPRWTKKKEELDEALLKEKTDQAKVELKMWESMLEGKDYLCGSEFTMADVFFFPLLAFFYRLGATFAEFPNLLKYYEKVVMDPCVEATWPPHWKDSKRLEMLSDL